MTDNTEVFNYCPHCATSLAERELFGRQRRYCPKCNYIHFIDPKVAAAAFITRIESGVGQVLLIQRTSEPGIGRWSLPAGFVERGEEPCATAIRETREETGLYVEIIGLLGEWTNGITLVHDYAARVTGGSLLAGDDAADAGWFSADSLPDLAFDQVRNLIDAWAKRGQLECLAGLGTAVSTK